MSIMSVCRVESLPAVEVQLARLLHKDAKSQGRHFRKRVIFKDWGTRRRASMRASVRGSNSG